MGQGVRILAVVTANANVVSLSLHSPSNLTKIEGDETSNDANDLAVDGWKAGGN